MKNRDAKMRERYLQKEYNGEQGRLVKVEEKRIRKYKMRCNGNCDKDRQEQEAFERLIEIAERFGGDG